MPTKTQKNDIDAFWPLLITILLTVGSIWYFTDQILTLLGAPVKQDERGQFGDMYGSINTLFSGLAFAFLIANTYMQSRQLKMQQEELALTRQEISAQLDQMKEQSAIFHKQVSDSIFFKLIDSLQYQASAVKACATSIVSDGEGNEDEQYRVESGIDGFDLIKSSLHGTIIIAGIRPNFDSSHFIKELRHNFYMSIQNPTSINTYLLIFKEAIKIAETENNMHYSLIKALLSSGERFAILVLLLIKGDYKAIESLHSHGFFHDLMSYYNAINRAICLENNQPDPGPNLL